VSLAAVHNSVTNFVNTDERNYDKCLAHAIAFHNKPFWHSEHSNVFHFNYTAIVNLYFFSSQVSKDPTAAAAAAVVAAAITAAAAAENNKRMKTLEKTN
jgi:hypothetical protein